MTLIAELRRRNIFRVALLYLVSSWLLLQLTSVAASAAGAEWVHRFIFALLVICFPLSLLFSWIYEITPQGLRRERDVRREESITAQTGRKLNRAIIVVLIAALLLEIALSFLAP